MASLNWLQQYLQEHPEMMPPGAPYPPTPGVPPLPDRNPEEKAWEDSQRVPGYEGYKYPPDPNPRDPVSEPDPNDMNEDDSYDYQQQLQMPGSQFGVPGIGNPQNPLQIPPPPPSPGSPFPGRRIEANAGGLLGSLAGLNGGGGQGLLPGGAGMDLFGGGEYRPLGGTPPMKPLQAPHNIRGGGPPGGGSMLDSLIGGGEYRPLTGRGPRPPAAAPYQLDAMNPLSMMSGGGEPALSVGGGAGDIAPDPTLSDSVAMQAPHNIRGDNGPGLLGDSGANTLGGGNVDMLGDGGPGAGGAIAGGDDGSNPGFFNKLFGGANRDRLGIGMSNIGAMLMASAGGDTAKGAAALQQGSQLLTNQRELEETADYHKKALEAHQAQAERERYSLGYQPDGKGGWTFVKGGPADPEAAAALTSARAAAQYDASVDPEDVKSIVDGWEDGTQPPDTTGMYKMGGKARAEASRRHFDYAGAKIQWERAKRQVAALNTNQMTQLVGLSGSVTRTLDEVDDLAKQVKNSGVIPLNKAKLDLFIKLKGNTPEGQLATRYRTAVGVLRAEFTKLENGGYAPTESAWKLGLEQINGDYGVDQLLASNKEIKRLINYRLHAIPNIDTLGPNAPNQYTGSQGQQYQEEEPGDAGPPPSGFDGGQDLWNEMTPEERSYW